MGNYDAFVHKGSPNWFNDCGKVSRWQLLQNWPCARMAFLKNLSLHVGPQADISNAKTSEPN